MGKIPPKQRLWTVNASQYELYRSLPAQPRIRQLRISKLCLHPKKRCLSSLNESIVLPSPCLQIISHIRFTHAKSSTAQVHEATSHFPLLCLGFVDGHQFGCEGRLLKSHREVLQMASYLNLSSQICFNLSSHQATSLCMRAGDRTLWGETRTPKASPWKL